MPAENRKYCNTMPRPHEDDGAIDGLSGVAEGGVQCFGLRNNPKNVAARSRPSRNWGNGVYAIQYFREDVFVDAVGEALAILRDGEILGSDQFGGVFEWRIVNGGGNGPDRVFVKLRIPPGGCLVTGYCVGDEGAVVDISGTLIGRNSNGGGTFEVIVEKVEVRFRYVGPAPMP